MPGVAVDILTGFLGSGKTTLLRHVLDHGLRGKPVAVIMNEIGEIGIDGRVVTGLSAVEKMVELTRDRKSTRLNSCHITISYAVFCLKKKKQHAGLWYPDIVSQHYRSVSLFSTATRTSPRYSAPRRRSARLGWLSVALRHPGTRSAVY